MNQKVGGHLQKHISGGTNTPGTETIKDKRHQNHMGYSLLDVSKTVGNLHTSHLPLVENSLKLLARLTLLMYTFM